MVHFFEGCMGKIRHYWNQIKKGRLRELRSEVKWIYGYAREHLAAIVLFTLLGLSGIAVSLISSLVSRDLVDIITGHKVAELLTTFLLMIAVTLGSSLIGQLSSYLSTKITLRVDNNIKAKVFDEIMSTEWESLTRYHSGDLLTRWSGDVSVISSGILNLIPNLIIYTVRFLSALAMVLYYDASFAVFALASIPISMLISRESMRRMRKSNAGSLAIGAKLSGFNQETFANVQTVKAFDMMAMYSKRLKELQKEYTGVRLHYQRVTIVNSIILTIVSMLVTYYAQGWGIYKVWNEDITYGSMVMFMGLSSTLTASVNSLITLVPSTITLSVASRRIREVINMPKEDYSQRDAVREFYEQHRGVGVGICARDVTYAYATGDPVFEHVSFEAHPHEIVSFVGPSGEGKTTMMRFLLALVQAQEGRGYLCAGDTTPENGDENMPLTAAVRQLCAYVPQGNTMLSGTIAQNMRNVKEDATDEEIIEALKIACAWEFVEKLPEGIHTELKERGGGLSEGQAQRLSIARAVLRKSPILLLDEATSALDIATERQVLENIMRDEYPRTSIVTTHRPSVLRQCNRVYAVRNKGCDLLTEEEVDRMISDF